MAASKAKTLIARMRRTTLGGKGFNHVVSDSAKYLLTGEITLKEAKAVNQAVAEQLRKFKRGS